MSDDDVSTTSVASEHEEDKQAQESAPNYERPLQIININEAGTAFELHSDILKGVLARAAKINPTKCAILSVVGAFRTGKSFLLDVLLRYLRYQEDKLDGKVTEEEDDGDAYPAWLRYGGSFLTEGNMNKDSKSDNHKGFQWRGGNERMTVGMWMYGRPFKLRLETGEDIAIVLMDTQGMFDTETCNDLTASIFGLSTLISSYQVYNLSKQIQEDNLQQLDFFTKFSLVALNRETAERKEERDEHPFQYLEFLVRDWQNFEDEEDIEGCLATMPPVLEGALKEREHIEDYGTREQIQKAFEHIECFLLPHPGKPMTKPNYDGEISKIDAGFVGLLDVYIKRIFSAGHVGPKRVQGRIVRPENLAKYIEAYADIFADGRLPKTVTLAEAISTTTNMCAKDDAHNHYRKAMRSLLDGASGAIEDTELEREHEEHTKAAYAIYDEQAVFGDETHIQATRALLGKLIAEELENVKKENSRKLVGRMVKYIFPVIFAVAAWVLDTFTDFTCDSWSQSCVELSRVLAFFYRIVFCMLAYELVVIYKSKGSLTAGTAAFALGQAALDTANKLSRDLSVNNLSEQYNSLSTDSLPLDELDAKQKKDQ